VYTSRRQGIEAISMAREKHNAVVAMFVEDRSRANGTLRLFKSCLGPTSSSMVTCHMWDGRFTATARLEMMATNAKCVPSTS
jgi:hypothetical protein